MPGETYVYEYTLRQHGTLMYHPHSDEMVQMALGMMGLFIVHPRGGENPRIDRDFAIMLHEWAIDPGTYTPNPAVMTDFNLFTFNARVWPGTAPLVVKKGERVRVRFGNLSMDSHPIHLHGYQFEMTGTDGGRVPVSARQLDEAIAILRQARRESQDVVQSVAILALALALDRSADKAEARAVLSERALADARVVLLEPRARDALGPLGALDAHAMAALSLEGANPQAARESWQRYLAGGGANTAWGDHARAHLGPAGKRIAPAPRRGP